MITIDPRLAQEIVARTMRIIACNVNVMDTRGIIIGSGEPARIGDLHAGAQLAIARQGAVEIDGAATRNLPGVKPGVNLPLSVRGRICGVVGLTGEPDAVRQFGELVRVAAEMILEQAQLIGELQREKGYREEFVYQLVKQGGTPLADLEAWAARLEIDFLAARTVVVLDLSEAGLRPDLALSELHRCQNRLSAQHPAILSAAVSPRELVILQSFAANAGRLSARALARQRLTEIEALLHSDAGPPSALAMGVALSGIEGVALSYQSAHRTLRAGRRRNPQGTAFSYYELSLPVLLAGVDAGWQSQQLRQPLLGLDAFDSGHGGALRRTLDAWFAANGRAAASAEALGIHRNTLDYRLRKISELTGLDLANTDDRLLLYVALQLE